MHLYEIEVSQNLAQELEKSKEIEILSEPYDIVFDEEGYIID